jgi:hypothetical protein
MKIAICTPYYANVSAEYTISLLRMCEWTRSCTIIYNGERRTPEVEVFLRKSSVLPYTRNVLVRDALAWGADYLLWIDADHAFPADSLTQLLSRNKAVIGVNQPRRSKPTYPTVTGLDGKLVWTTEGLANAGSVEEVESLGLALCLVDAHVLSAVRAALQDKGQALFSLEMLGDGCKIVGEDQFFCRNIREHGHHIFVDHELSWRVGHLFETLLKNADTITQREEAAHLGLVADL